MYGLYKIKAATEKGSQEGSHSLAIPETGPARDGNDVNMKEEAKSAMTQGTKQSSADDESESNASTGVKTQKKHDLPSARKYERKSRQKSDESHEPSKDKIEKGLRLAPAVEPSHLLNEEQESRRGKGPAQEDHDVFLSSEEFDAPGAVRVSGGYATEVGEAMPLPSSQRPTETLIEAELADDKEEQRQQELEARTIHLEQQLQDIRRQQDVTVVVAVENVESAEASETKRRRLLLYCTIILVAIAIAGGVTAGILLKKKESTTDANPTDSPVVATLTPDPPTTPAPTTKHPTESPTESVPFYDPPSEEDCLAIANNDSVEDQHLLVAKALEIEFDVTLNEEQVVSLWLDDFMEEVEEHLALLLTGCLEDTHQDVVAGDQGSTRHHRKLARNIRYVIANVIASGKYNIDQSCQAGAEQPCYRIFASLQLFLKGDETVLSLVTLITDLLESDQADRSLVERLDLPSLFKTVEVAGINNLNSESPSSQSSTNPSASPTDQPSTSPTTPLPTLDPTGKPTALPTPHLTKRPTLLPTKGPTPNPSRRPTSNPILDPTPYPTRDPTLYPTLNLTRDPTPHPTSMPSFQPSNVCYDDPSFVSKLNGTCDWYESNEDPWCDEEGGNIGTCNISGFSANLRQASNVTVRNCTAWSSCCYCCQNIPGFEDRFGKGCEWYEQREPVGCVNKGNTTGTCGGGSSCTANEACCHCKGDGVNGTSTVSQFNWLPSWSRGRW